MIRQRIARLRQLFAKDRPRVQDHLHVSGGDERPNWRGMRMPDGSPVTVETIMATYGVGRGMAEEIAKRNLT